jgi:hypothetical protein
VNAAVRARRDRCANPPGTSGQWAAEHHSSYEITPKAAEVGYHAREPGQKAFEEKRLAAHDAKTAELQGVWLGKEIMA